MSPNLGVLCEPSPVLDSEPEWRTTNNPLVLIRVPALPSETRASRPSSTNTQWPSSVRHRRRRLRREVRVAALALCFSVPIAGLLLNFWPSESPRETPDHTLMASIPSITESDQDSVKSVVRPWVTISLEPAAGDRISDFQSPVVRPAGFLLPDHGSEEPAHAGG